MFLLRKIGALPLVQKFLLLGTLLAIIISGGVYLAINADDTPSPAASQDQKQSDQQIDDTSGDVAGKPDAPKTDPPAANQPKPSTTQSSGGIPEQAAPAPASSDPQPTPAASWTWPANATNTGPTSSLAPYTGPHFITVDGTIIRDKDIVMNDGEELVIQANNVQFINSRIRYAGTADSDNCFVCLLQGYQGTVFDHVEMDANHRFEYGLLAFSPFTVKYSEFHAASHVIDAAGDPSQGNPTYITNSYIYDADNKPFSNTNQYGGHAAAIYFSGDNSPVYISENTIVTPRYALGPTCPPNPCHDNSVTAAVAIYADEGVISPSIGSYNYHHNAISSGGYYYTQFRGGTGGIKTLNFTNNVLMADAGWPNGTIDGGTYILENVANATFTGNIWGPGTPNAGQAANN